MKVTAFVALGIIGALSTAACTSAVEQAETVPTASTESALAGPGPCEQYYRALLACGAWGIGGTVGGPQGGAAAFLACLAAYGIESYEKYLDLARQCGGDGPPVNLPGADNTCMDDVSPWGGGGYGDSTQRVRYCESCCKANQQTSAGVERCMMACLPYWKERQDNASAWSTYQLQ